MQIRLFLLSFRFLPVAHPSIFHLHAFRGREKEQETPILLRGGDGGGQRDYSLDLPAAAEEEEEAEQTEPRVSEAIDSTNISPSSPGSEGGRRREVLSWLPDLSLSLEEEKEADLAVFQKFCADEDGESNGGLHDRK